MVKINKDNLYYVLPTQRYDLTTHPPSQTMQGNFTFWAKFKVNKKIKTKVPCSVMMRPGLHYGLCYNQDHDSINWEFWYNQDGESDEFGMTTLCTNHEFKGKTLFDTEWLVIIRHIEANKAFTMHVYDDVGKLITRETTYEGKLKDFSGTPYNFGCGNYFKQVGDDHYFFGDYNLYNCGLIENVEYDDGLLLEFIDKTKNDKDELKGHYPLLDLVFYFNFNNRTLYKVWDLSGHCNFLAVNTDLGT